MKAYLVLGCNGHVDSDGFLSCAGIANPILDLSQLTKEQQDKTIKFLDRACGLFDNPIYDHNKSINVVDMLYREIEVLSEEMLFKVQSFSRMHKNCGLFLILIMKEDFYVEERFAGSLGRGRNFPTKKSIHREQGKPIETKGKHSI